MIAVIHYWRLNTGEPWKPGGVAVFGSVFANARYVDLQDAAPAKASLEAGVGMLLDAIRAADAPISELVVRLARSGFSGHLYQWLVLEVPDEYSLGDVFRHYVTEGRVALLPGSSEVEVTLPFA